MYVYPKTRPIIATGFSISFQGVSLVLNVPPRYKLDTVLNLPKVKFSQTTKLGEYRFVINNRCSSDFGRSSEMEELKEGKN